ncbi:hypothetical protein LguiA_003278 [Lonicera macranthoides]
MGFLSKAFQAGESAGCRNTPHRLAIPLRATSLKKRSWKTYTIFSISALMENTLLVVQVSFYHQLLDRLVCILIRHKFHMHQDTWPHPEITYND